MNEHIRQISDEIRNRRRLAHSIRMSMSSEEEDAFHSSYGQNADITDHLIKNYNINQLQHIIQIRQRQAAALKAPQRRSPFEQPPLTDTEILRRRWEMVLRAYGAQSVTIDSSNIRHYLNIASDELRTLGIPADEARLRLLTIQAALSGRIASGNTRDERDPDHWETGKDGRWKFSASGSPTKGLEHAFTRDAGDRYSTACRRACILDKLRAQAQYAKSIGCQENFDGVVKGKELSELFPETPLRNGKNINGVYTGVFERVKVDNQGINPLTLIPGDQTWVQNPGQSANSLTLEGSNKIYIGGGLWVAPYSDAVGSTQAYNFHGYLSAITAYGNDVGLRDLVINRVHQPLVPKFLYERTK